MIIPPAASKPHRNVFVCGLHRSGTSLVASAIARHPDVASFSGTNALEQEGQFLQSILPTDNEFCGPGRFAFHPGAHLTELSPLASAANAAQLTAEWARFHTSEKATFVEKSPPNLLRTRLLQALFPEACFVVVMRHPIAVALATQKWTHTSPFSLIAHWLQAHTLFEQDRPRLKRVMIVTYEAFVADPVAEVQRAWRFLDLAPHQLEISATDYNRRYFDRWQSDFGAPVAKLDPMLRATIWQRVRKRLKIATAEGQELYRLRLGRRSDAHDAIVAFDHAVRAFGYSLTDYSLVPEKEEESVLFEKRTKNFY